MNKRIGGLLGCLTIGGALVLGGCGGSSAPAASNTPGPISTSPGGTAAGTFTSSQCVAALQAIAEASRALVGGAGRPLDEAALESRLKNLVSAAPEALRADMQTVLSALQRYFKAVHDAGADFASPATVSDPTKAQKIAKAASKFVHDSGAAGQRLRAGLIASCGTPPTP